MTTKFLPFGALDGICPSLEVLQTWIHGSILYKSRGMV